MDLDDAMFRGDLIAARAILSGILKELGEMHGYQVVRRIRVHADEHCAAARQRMFSGSPSDDEIAMAKESDSCADGFLAAAFQAAYDAE